MTSPISLKQILTWPEIGNTYNEESGVDSIRAKKVNGKWLYVQVEWSHTMPWIGFVLYDGQILEATDEGIDLVTSDYKPTLSLSNPQESGIPEKETKQ